MMERFYIWISWKLPTRFISACAMRLIVETTTGKYSNTIIPELSAMGAVNRFSRIHGHGGSGKDEHYDSNRNRK